MNYVTQIRNLREDSDKTQRIRAFQCAAPADIQRTKPQTFHQ